MKISPLDIYNKEFSKSVRGYNTAEVDDFIEDVGLAYEKALKRIDSLQEEKEKLEERVENYQNIEDELNETLVTIQQTVKQQTKTAKKEADAIIEKARMKAVEIKQDSLDEIKEEINKLEKLKDTRQLFEIRFKNLLNSFKQMMESKRDKGDIDVDSAIKKYESEFEDVLNS